MVRTSALYRRTFQLGLHPIDWYRGEQCLEAIAQEILAHGYRHCVVVADPHAWKLHGAGLREPLERAAGVTLVELEKEAQRNVTVLAQAAERILRAGVDATACVVSLGGGLAGSFAGMLAALLFRGLPLLHIPTTTVAMFDASLSIRQSVNGGGRKNTIAAFHHPTAIFCDLACLDTLPWVLFREGLVELAKGCLVTSREAARRLLTLLTSEEREVRARQAKLLELAVEVKLAAIGADPTEAMEGRKLHYGHTLGHIFEELAQGALSHGDAVVAGMACAQELAQAVAGLRGEDLKLHQQLLKWLSPQTAEVGPFQWDEVQAHLLHGRERLTVPRAGADPRFILLEALGHPLRTEGVPLIAVELPLIKTVVLKLGLARE